LALKPANKFTVSDLTKITLEYEKLLNIAVEYYLLSVNHQPPQSRIRSLGKRLIVSLSRDGTYVTAEKIVRKTLAKVRASRS
jgi:hypothetical protein